MKRIPFVFVIFSAVLFLSSSCIESYVDVQDNTPIAIPDDFNFSLTYGTYGKQKVDTFNDTVIKDLVEDGTVEAHITLTLEEKELVYDEMMKINIMGELEIEKEPGCGEAEPPSFTALHIQMHGETKEFSYTTFCEYPENVKRLFKLEDFIHDLVSAKEEYQELPEANGWYE